MRILIWSYVPPSPDSAYWFWFKDGMEAVGHQVIVVDSRALAAVFGPQQMQHLLLAYAEAYRVQAAIVMPQNYAEPWLLRALQQRGIAVVGFRYDDSNLFSPTAAALMPAQLTAATLLDPYCDLAVTISKRAPALLAAAGLPSPTYIPMPYGWQAVPLEDLPRRPVIAFVGGPKQMPDLPPSIRVQVVRALIAAGLPIELHNDGWSTLPDCAPYARPTVPLADYHRLFATSQVNLAITSDWSHRWEPQMKGLVLEIASAGGMVLTYPCEELADIFTDGELALADSIDGFVAQARRYLADADAARALGLAARRTMERTCGWEIWWESVAGELAKRGKHLDLQAGHLEPAAEQRPTLLLAASALAHVHEAAGQPVLAKRYYSEMLLYDPQNYSAHAGLARLSDTPSAARQHWRTATASVSLTQAALDNHPIKLPGVGPLGSAYAMDAARQWLDLALEAEAADDVAELAPHLMIFDWNIGTRLAQWFLDKAKQDLAWQCLNQHLQFWPKDYLGWSMKADLAFETGRYAEAGHANQMVDRWKPLSMGPQP